MIKKRIEKIMQNLENAEALLILSEPNRFYLTGFSSSAGTLLITKEKSYFLIDFRYYEKAKATLNYSKVILLSKYDEQVCELLKHHNIKSLFVETNYVNIKQFNIMKKALENIFISTDAKFVNLIEDMRSVKDEQELNFIKKAQSITDKTFSYILNNIKQGRTERDIMLDMEYYMRRLGSEGVSFDFIVVSGKNSSLPHGVPTDKPLQNGDFLTIDFGAVVNTYRSDMTRTVALGYVTDEQRRVYNTVLKAQQCAIKSVKAGVVCKDVDKIARDIIYDAGYEGCFGHGLGHSVGIEIHENPSFNLSCETPLKAGMVMTVEPGIYLENKFGVRIEDMVFVTNSGCTNITESKKELIIL